MELTQVSRLARVTMKAQGLEGWSFKWDRASTRFGLCNFSKKEITMSSRLAELNDEATCYNTILHEVAHALVGPHHGHNAVWAAKHRELGGDGRARYSASAVIPTPKKWLITCPECKATSSRSRRPAHWGSMVCGRCKRAGRYLYPLVWKENPAA